MTINNFALACAIDQSPPYFTYEKNTMIIIQSEQDAKSGQNSFSSIEPFMDALISHESIHVVIKALENATISDSLDDLEVVVEHNGTRFQVSLNNILFARDNSGLVLP
ncbi:MAG TPA: hypothetical protein VJP79_10760 [Nitrososphaera sp.]|jgi:hypothetical protein|nr:hypothetical protein [Nitrososphaera sp.]